MERSSSDIEKFNLKKTSYILGSIFPSSRKKKGENGCLGNFYYLLAVQASSF